MGRDICGCQCVGILEAETLDMHWWGWSHAWGYTACGCEGNWKQRIELLVCLGIVIEIDVVRVCPYRGCSGAGTEMVCLGAGNADIQRSGDVDKGSTMRALLEFVQGRGCKRTVGEDADVVG